MIVMVNGDVDADFGDGDADDYGSRAGTSPVGPCGEDMVMVMVTMVLLMMVINLVRQEAAKTLI